MLFESLRNKVMTLPDSVIVYPAHGAGSACGKNMSKETTDTLANQKKNNYALRSNMTKEEFVKEVTDGLMPPPQYFPLNVMMNKEGYDSIDEVLERGQHALTPAAFEAVATETGALILDTRDPQVFVKGFIPNSINIGIDGSFAPWVGTMIPDIKHEILIVAEQGREKEVVTRLARVGYDHCIGFLDGGFEKWKESGFETDTIESISPDKLKSIIASDSNTAILDVRKNSEYLSEHLFSAENAPLDFINESAKKINSEKKYFVHCAGGYRSMIFISTLRARGYHNLVDVNGGFKAIKENGGFTLTDYICPTTLL
jgi:rhodanese-related sulfurtransferase